MLGLRVRGRGGRDPTAAVAAPKSAFLWGSSPFLCARAKKWGGTGRGSAVYCLIKRRTRKRRKLGIRLFFTFVRVRRYFGRFSLPCPAIRPHFFGACPKKRCRAAKEKRLFYPGGSTIRVSAPASVDDTHLRPTWGGAWWLSERLPSPGANGICYGCFARLVDCAGVTVVISFRSPPKARFFGAPPRFFAQEQRNGVERAAGGRDFCPA